MRIWILTLTLLAVPAVAQTSRVDNMKSFRQDLSAAVHNGNLTADEKQSYESALKTLDTQREARKSGHKIDRQATRQAMMDLAVIARSCNLKEEDRAKLAEHMAKARDRAKQGKRRTPAA